MFARDHIFFLSDAPKRNCKADGQRLRSGSCREHWPFHASYYVEEETSLQRDSRRRRAHRAHVSAPTTPRAAAAVPPRPSFPVPPSFQCSCCRKGANAPAEQGFRMLQATRAERYMALLYSPVSLHLLFACHDIFFVNLFGFFFQLAADVARVAS